MGDEVDPYSGGGAGGEARDGGGDGGLPPGALVHHLPPGPSAHRPGFPVPGHPNPSSMLPSGHPPASPFGAAPGGPGCGGPGGAPRVAGASNPALQAALADLWAAQLRSARGAPADLAVFRAQQLPLARIKKIMKADEARRGERRKREETRRDNGGGRTRPPSPHLLPLLPPRVTRRMSA